jgi:hypothetical protein
MPFVGWMDLHSLHRRTNRVEQAAGGDGSQYRYKLNFVRGTI